MTACKTIDCHYQTLEDLHHAYLPFVQNKGLFIKTEKSYTLGDEVTLVIRLINETTVYQSPGKIIWIVPMGSHLPTPSGVGVQLMGSNHAIISTKMEALLAGFSSRANASCA